MLVLDLFSGTQSLKAVCDDLDYEYISLDIDAATNPSVTTDIMEWDYKNSNKYLSVVSLNILYGLLQNVNGIAN